LSASKLNQLYMILQNYLLLQWLVLLYVLWITVHMYRTSNSVAESWTSWLPVSPHHSGIVNWVYRWYLKQSHTLCGDTVLMLYCLCIMLVDIHLSRERVTSLVCPPYKRVRSVPLQIKMQRRSRFTSSWVRGLIGFDKYLLYRDFVFNGKLSDTRNFYAKLVKRWGWSSSCVVKMIVSNHSSHLCKKTKFWPAYQCPNKKSITWYSRLSSYQYLT